MVMQQQIQSVSSQPVTTTHQKAFMLPLDSEMAKSFYPEDDDLGVPLDQKDIIIKSFKKNSPRMQKSSVETSKFKTRTSMINKNEKAPQNYLPVTAQFYGPTSPDQTNSIDVHPYGIDSEDITSHQIVRQSQNSKQVKLLPLGTDSTTNQGDPAGHQKNIFNLNFLVNPNGPEATISPGPASHQFATALPPESGLVTPSASEQFPKSAENVRV